MRTLALALLLIAPAAARAGAPAWATNPCADLDCAATPAGVGQADLLPETAISSAIAYAQAARVLSASLTEFVSVNERQYGEEVGQSVDSAVKDMVKSPLGSAMTKTYGSAEADTISVAIGLKRIADAAVRVYAQEFVDVSSGTLYVRLLLDRSASAAPPSGFAAWPGRRVKLSSQDVRVGRRDEFTLWVQDEEAGLTWVEQWPLGGADLMKDGQVSAKYVFDRDREAWKPAPVAARDGNR